MMKNRKQEFLLSQRWKLITTVLALLATVALFAPLEVKACDACNLSFAEEVIAGPRANTLVGKDARRAMENQRNLRLDGFANQALVNAQLSRLDEISGTAAVASTDPFACCTVDPDASSTSVVDTEQSACCGANSGDGKRVDPGAIRAKEIERGGWFELAMNLEDRSGGVRNSAMTSRVIPDYMRTLPFSDIIQRDYALPPRPYSTVPQDAPVDKSFTIRLNEGSVYIGNGIVYEGFLMDGSIPGQTIIVDEGDVVEFIVENTGDIPHGMSIHAAYTQTSRYVGSIGARSTKSVRFRAMTPGVYMYHCAPGGHAIGMHVLGGQYGMMLVRPKPGSYQLEKELGHKPNLELFLVQHELYATGKDAIAGHPEYVMFNGRTFRYIEEPILTKPGDYVRINFLNVGPNLLSTFHIVGIIWDYIYWQGHPEAMLPGGQTVTAGPSDSFVIEFRMPPDEGAYTMLSHAVGSTNRGAIGLLVVDGEAELETHRTILSEGPVLSEQEIQTYRSEATRIISPFGIGTHPLDRPVVYGPETREVHVSIIGNSFYPKAVQVAPGTRIIWTNEDAFTYLAGEYSGVHNAASNRIPAEDMEGFNLPLLVHGESASHVFNHLGEYEYICTPHPYMIGRVIVAEPEYSLSVDQGGGSAPLGGWILPLLAACLVLSTASLVIRRKG